METGEIVLAPNAARASQIPAVEDFLLRTSDVIGYSGCGEIKAEGVVGIPRAFLGAGARAVLVSLLTIDDHTTQEFMKSF